MDTAEMRPARLVELAAAAFVEVMRAQGRPKAMIRHVADTARERAEAALAEQGEVPAREAFGVAFDEVSAQARDLLTASGHFPETVAAIRDAAHALARRVDGEGGVGDSVFLQAARRRVSGPDGPGG